MENNTPNSAPRANARDFFLHLGSMIALYVVTISFVNLLFKIINKTFPEVAQYYYWGSGSEISMPVATLIIVFPIFVLLSWFVYKTYSADENKKHLSVRKWLTYITLFVAGIILVGDLVMVLYKFLDGQDITFAFLLKALIVLLVSGAVFGYYLQDIRDRFSSKTRKIWTVSVAVIIVVAIVLGFGVLGSPRSQRLLRLDNQIISDLQEIEWRIINYWQINGEIPANYLDVATDCTKNDCINQNLKGNYEYRKTGEMSFELCATFNSEFNGYTKTGYSPNPYMEPVGKNMDVWNHKAGHHCFSRTIDPVAYPVYPKVVR